MSILDYEDIIGRLGKDKTEIIRHVHSLKQKDLFILAESLSLSLESTRRNGDKNPFSYVATPSLSGAGYPCSDYDCRRSKVMELGTFASLYSDHTFVQDPFEELAFYNKKIDTNEILFAISSVKYLLPLAKSGLLSFAKRALPVCNHCLDSAYSINVEDIQKKSHEINELTKREFSEKCTITAIQNEDKSYSIEVKGPENLVSHEQMFLLLRSK